MNTDPLDKLVSWIAEEIAILREKGASDADLAEFAFAKLAVERALEKHSLEISQDQELREAMFIHGLQKCDPHGLRQIAATLRDQRNFGLAYFVETLADRRERGEESL